MSEKHVWQNIVSITYKVKPASSLWVFLNMRSAVIATRGHLWMMFEFLDLFDSPPLFPNFIYWPFFTKSEFFRQPLPLNWVFINGCPQTLATDIFFCTWIWKVLSEKIILNCSERKYSHSTDMFKKLMQKIIQNKKEF